MSQAQGVERVGSALDAMFAGMSRRGTAGSVAAVIAMLGAAVSAVIVFPRLSSDLAAAGTGGAAIPASGSATAELIVMLCLFAVFLAAAAASPAAGWFGTTLPRARRPWATLAILTLAYMAALYALQVGSELVLGGAAAGTSTAEAYGHYSPASMLLAGASASTYEEFTDVAVPAAAAAFILWSLRTFGRVQLQRSTGIAVVIAALICGVALRFTDHLYQGGPDAIAAAASGVVDVALFLRWRSVWPLVLGHFLWDGVAVAAITAALS